MTRTGWWMGLALLGAVTGCEGAATGGDPAPPSAPGAWATDGGVGMEPSGEPIPLPEPAPEPEPEPVLAPHTCAPGLPGRPGVHLVTLPHGGLLRRAIVHVPEAYDPRAGTTLVLNFHGFTSADWQQALLSRMDRAVDERSLIVVYPQGVGVSWNAGDCCGTAWTDSVDDVGFVGALLDELEADYCVDPRRIYATGMSNGGFISHRLACEMSDRIAAIAPVAGVLGVEPADCTPSRPVPVWQFHGTEDPLVRYEGGLPLLDDLGVRVAFRSVEATLDHWARINGCDEGSESLMWAEGDSVCVARDGCDAPVRLCTVYGGGHTWPGGMPIPFLGRTSRDLDATTAMLEFFEAHPMR